ncbi:branched-chain amino acid cytosolic [Pochonia chlamydosporia 170]|uniref:Branched-chain amino acid cytosolic n=1 Tax=Pochonia chlamydosporia 170 TaxID=1380566 RepID=A0A179FKI4_METCM|nr:branched-chain amino acid cytosolic [Pochonia chlamydosporia 170]OAQ65858.1 branched-chain amino acid cytosolic [Pochonia chlamydosporia 170]
MTFTPSIAPLDASKTVLELTTKPKPVPAPNSPEVASITAYTDHMLLVSWNAKHGWDTPRIVPYGPISLEPGASIFQYATNCYEGMKAFRGFDGRLRLLRPMYNCERMLASATRISLPIFEPEELLKLIKKICSVEAPKWLSKDQAGSALYIRPTMIGTDTSLGVKVPEQALLCIFLTYWPNPYQQVSGVTPKLGSRLLASSGHSVRAWPKGTGEAKIGANYGPALVEHAEARRRGYDQILWLFGPDRHITEAGGSNIFVMWWTSEGVLQLITPPLDEDKLILAGGTRRNLLELSRDMFAVDEENGAARCEVLERKITMFEVQQAADEGRLAAVFVAGTAFWVYPVAEICFNGRDIMVDVGRVPHVAMLRSRLEDIVYGREESSWVDIVEEN